MITLYTLITLALIINGSFTWYFYHVNHQNELKYSRFMNQASSEIEYLEARNEALRQVIERMNYHGAADWIEHLAQKRSDGKLVVLTGQAEGLQEAATFLRREARRIGLEKNK